MNRFRSIAFRHDPHYLDWKGGKKPLKLELAVPEQLLVTIVLSSSSSVNEINSSIKDKVIVVKIVIKFVYVLQIYGTVEFRHNVFNGSVK